MREATRATFAVRGVLAFAAGCTDNAAPSVPTPTPACAQITAACADAGDAAFVQDCLALAADPSSSATACYARSAACAAACTLGDGGADDASADDGGP